MMNEGSNYYHGYSGPNYQDNKDYENRCHENRHHEDKWHEVKCHEEKCHEDKCHEDKWHEDKCDEDKCHKDRCDKEKCHENKCDEDKCHKDKCHEKKCDEKKCGGDKEEGCKATLSEILRNIKRYGCNTPVTIYLNSPSTISANSNVSNINLTVSGNAPITGVTAEQTVDLSQTQGRIAPRAITISATGTANVPGLAINPRDVLTDEVTVPLEVESTGTANFDLSGGNASVNIPRLTVSGSTTAQTVNVPITQVSPIRINTGSVDNVLIPSLDVCSRPCGGRDNNGQGSSGSQSQENCGCIRFNTRATQVQTQGVANFIDVPVAPALRATANIPSTTVTGQSAATNVIAPLSGQGTATVNVSSVPDSNLPIPRTGVSGRTAGAADVPVTATGTNTNSVPLSGSVTVGGASVSGSAATNGLPVNGTITVNTNITETPISFTGIVEYVDCNIVILREVGTNRRIVISLCDISKIEFSNFRGIQSMAEVFRQNRLDQNSCAYGIQRALQEDKCKTGTIELFGSSTNNPLNGLINTRNILVVAGGVLWTAYGQPGNCVTNTVYSLCNIAGYVFTDESWDDPCR